MPHSADNKQSEATTFTLGQQLKFAREELKLSIDDVIRETQLKRSVIDALENDIFILPNIAPAFVRGYVRNYVRFLRLPEALVQTVNYGEVTIPKESVSLSLKTANTKSQHRWVKCLTFLVLLIAFGMTLVWWWQEHQKDLNSRESLVANNLTVESQPEVNQTAPLLAVENTESKAETPAETQQMTEINVATPPAEEIVLQPVAENTTVLNTVENASPTVEAKQQITSVVVQPEEKRDINTPMINDELRIEITQAMSWIAVSDGSKKLVEKTFYAGEVLNFNNHESYRLTIGAPVNVKLYYKGELVPLKIDGRVARIKLPLQ